jgi:hypothetical protein
MGPPSDTGESPGAAEETKKGIGRLDEKPGAQEEVRRNFEHRKNQQKRYQGKYSGAGVEDEVSAHHAGYCPAGSHSRNPRTEIQQHMEARGGHAAEEIEEKIAEVAETVLDIVAKDPQTPDIAEEMEPTPVKEHVGEERDRALRQQDMGGITAGDLGGDQAVASEEEGVVPPTVAHNIDEDRDGQADESGVNERGTLSWYVVFEGNHTDVRCLLWVVSGETSSATELFPWRSGLSFSVTDDRQLIMDTCQNFTVLQISSYSLTSSGVSSRRKSFG